MHLDLLPIKGHLSDVAKGSGQINAAFLRGLCLSLWRIRGNVDSGTYRLCWLSECNGRIHVQVHVVIC